MNRILFEPGEIVDGAVAFGGARAAHVAEVLHGEPGQILKTGVIGGPVGTSEILSVERTATDGTGVDGDEAAPGWRVSARCRHGETPPAPWIDLVLAPPRPRALKRLLPQLAALGVGRIVLVGAEKVEKAFWGAQLLKEAVYRPLLVEGLMQAGTTALPEIRAERNFARWARARLADEFAGAPKFVAHPYGAGGAPDGFPCAPAGARPVVAIGPEGGWTDGEVGTLERLGFRRISLGRRILRTDTATVALLAQLMERYDNR